MTVTLEIVEPRLHVWCIYILYYTLKSCIVIPKTTSPRMVFCKGKPAKHVLFFFPYLVLGIIMVVCVHVNVYYSYSVSAWHTWDHWIFPSWIQDLQLRPWASMVGVSSILQCRSAAGLGEKHHPKWGLNTYHPCLAKTWMIVDDSMHLDDFSPFISIYSHLII